MSTSPYPPKLTVSIDDGVSTLTSEGTAELTVTLVREPGPASLIYTNVVQSVSWLGYREYCTLSFDCWVEFPLTTYGDSSPLGPTPVTSSVVVDGPYTPSDFFSEMTGVATADSFSVSGSVDCDPTDSWDVNVGTGRLNCLGQLSATFTVDKATEVVISYDSSNYEGVFEIHDGPTTIWYLEDPAGYSYEKTVILVPEQTYQLSYLDGIRMDPYSGEPPCFEPCVASWDFSLEVVNPAEPVPGPGVVGLVGLACAVGLGGWRLARGSLRCRD